MKSSNKNLDSLQIQQEMLRGAEKENQSAEEARRDAVVQNEAEVWKEGNNII